ncbi:hypothetical protein PAA26_03885 [Methanomassiliicoccaceae archaeon COG_1]|nr:hypothetical protein [Methanomassiliicoccaceae archaeon COG_1]
MSESPFARYFGDVISGLKGRVSSPRILNETPEVVGTMSIVIGNGGSLDAAIRGIAKEGPPISASIFTRIADRADTRVEADMKASLAQELSRLPEEASSYSMALHMVVSASNAREAEERDRMLRDASNVALTGLREAGKTYSSSLNAPCMMVFGIGIMVPMVLMSVLPMLSVSGMFGATSIGLGQVTVVTLVFIPAMVVLTMLSIRDRNPFMPEEKKRTDIRLLLPLASAAPAFAGVCAVTGDPVSSMCIAGAAGGVLCLAAVLPKYRGEALRARREAQLQDAVFETGNRLVSGDSFEDALVKAVAERADCGPVAESLRREFSICRGDVQSAVRNALGGISPLVSETVCEIHRASLRDLRDAGRLALSVGRQMKDQEGVRRSIRSDLRGMTDTMFGTASVFAPLVLGLSISMLGPLSRITGGIDISGTAEILVVYLVELCALLAVLISFLDGKVATEDIVRRFSVMLPVSLLVFLASIGVNL